MIVQNANLQNQNVPLPDRIGRATAQRGDAAGVAVAATDASTVQQPSAVQLKTAVDKINSVLRQANRNLEFSVDDATKRVIVKVVDTETGELIRQIPSEETLAISRAIGEVQRGLLLRQKA
ncbi:MAG: flagellar protein FlaG [Rhodocyclales bacterium]|nr:flagellar protein FlaG [Rhodocyclales bacterium]